LVWSVAGGATRGPVHVPFATMTADAGASRSAHICAGAPLCKAEIAIRHITLRDGRGDCLMVAGTRLTRATDGSGFIVRRNNITCAARAGAGPARKHDFLGSALDLEGRNQ
jgi:hypothetical protein